MRQVRKRRHAYFPGLRARFWPWPDMAKHGWTRDNRGDIRNPKREQRRKTAAAFLAHTGRPLSGRQYIKLRKGH